MTQIAAATRNGRECSARRAQRPAATATAATSLSRSGLWLAATLLCLAAMAAIHLSGVQGPWADALFAVLAVGGFHSSSRQFKAQEQEHGQGQEGGSND